MPRLDQKVATSLDRIEEIIDRIRREAAALMHPDDRRNLDKLIGDLDDELIQAGRGLDDIQALAEKLVTIS